MKKLVTILGAGMLLCGCFSAKERTYFEEYQEMTDAGMQQTVAPSTTWTKSPPPSMTTEPTEKPADTNTSVIVDSTGAPIVEEETPVDIWLPEDSGSTEETTVEETTEEDDIPTEPDQPRPSPSVNNPPPTPLPEEVTEWVVPADTYDAEDTESTDVSPNDDFTGEETTEETTTTAAEDTAEEYLFCSSVAAVPEDECPTQASSHARVVQCDGEASPGVPLEPHMTTGWSGLWNCDARGEGRFCCTFCERAEVNTLGCDGGTRYACESPVEPFGGECEIVPSVMSDLTEWCCR